MEQELWVLVVKRGPGQGTYVFDSHERALEEWEWVKSQNPPTRYRDNDGILVITHDRTEFYLESVALNRGPRAFAGVA
jgi:hypothetical protein